MSLRRLCAFAAFAVIAAGCGKTVNQIIVPTPSPTTPTPTPAPTLAPIAAVTTSNGSAVIGAVVTLDGSQSVDPQGGTLVFSWELTVRPDGSDAVLAGADTATPSFVPDVVGGYVAKLVVTDTLGIESAPAYVDVAAATCGTAAPSIATLLATSVDTPPAQGDLVTLSAPQLSDPNAACGSRVLPLHYEWSLFQQPPSSNAQLSSPTSAAPSFVADVAGGSYTFSLTVTDALGNQSAPEFLTVLASSCGANPPFVSSIAQSAAESVANGADLFATVGDADNSASCPARFADSFSYAWSVVSAPAGATAQISQGGATAHLAADRGGSYQVAVTVKASNGLSSPPATALVTMSACGSFPPVTNGFALTQALTNTGGGTQTLAEIAPTPGGGAGTSTTGWYLGAPITVADNGVSDADASTCGLPAQSFTYAWQLLQAPAGSAVALGASSGPGVAFAPDVPGVYAFAVTTTDVNGNASTSSVALTVSCGNAAPSIGGLAASQTVDGSVVLGTPGPVAIGAPITLAATDSDPDSTPNASCTVPEAQPLTYHWSLIGAPPGSVATIADPGLAAPSFTPDVVGLYGLSLTVTDPQGHVSTQTLGVDATCNAQAPSVVPVAAGVPDFRATQSVVVNGGTTLFQERASNPSLDSASLGTRVPFYPGATVSLVANVVPQQSGVAGCPVLPMSLSYAWSLVSAPTGSSAALASPASATPSFVPDLAGAYTFALKLTDANTGLSSTTLLADDTTGAVVVNIGVCGTAGPVPSVAVTAPFATTSFPATEPLSATIALDASGSSDTDSILYPAGCGLTRTLSYHWAFSAKPAASSSAFDDASIVNPSFTSDKLGTYGVSLTVDDGFHSATRSVSIFSSPSTSSPGASGAVFTASTVDGSGNPLVAWWDNANGVVSAARCTSNCGQNTATWSSLGTIDSGLTAGLTFATTDEPRPIAIAANGSDVWVAYFAGRGSGGTTGAHGASTCGVTIAHSSGGGFTSWTSLQNGVGLLGSTFCTAGGAPTYVGYEHGRWLSMTVVGGLPVVAFWAVVGANATEPEIVPCGNAACSSPPVALRPDPAAGTTLLGKWVSLVVDPGGFFDLAHFAENDGTSNPALRFVTNRGGSFVETTLATGNVGRFSSLANAGGGGLALAYRDGVAKSALLRGCTFAGPACSFAAPVTVPDAGSSDYGYDTLVACDAAGAPRIAFGDASGGAVHVLLAGNPSASTGFTDDGSFVSSTAPAGLSLSFGGGHANVAFDGTTPGPVEFAQTN